MVRVMSQLYPRTLQPQSMRTASPLASRRSAGEPCGNAAEGPNWTRPPPETPCRANSSSRILATVCAASLLAVVKAIAELHGGSVRVRSVIEQGSMFSVYLPIRP